MSLINQAGAYRGTLTTSGVVIQTETGPQTVPKSVFDSFQRTQRIQENIERFLMHAWTTRQPGTFIDEDGKDMANE